jgi:hypothetical protein
MVMARHSPSAFDLDLKRRISARLLDLMLQQAHQKACDHPKGFCAGIPPRTQ